MDGINGWKAFNTGVLCGSVWKISNVPPSVDTVMDDAVVEQLNEIFRRSDSADFLRPALTDAEREAVETAVYEAEAHQHVRRAATLRGLLERTA